jgi:hypothetical protein
LAKRLAGLYHLLHFPAAEFPPYFRKHGIFLDADFVTRLDAECLSEEELRWSSMEIAAQKWSIGFVAEDRVRNAIRYCLARSSVKGHRFDYPSRLSALWATPSELSFLLRNLAPERRSRRCSKAFLSPLPASKEVLVPTSVVDQLLFDLGRGPLPSYTELLGPNDMATVRCG